MKGNQVVGMSSDVGMAPTPINLSTGMPVAGDSEIIYPEHVIQAMFHDVGITDDPADLRVDPLKAILKQT